MDLETLLKDINFDLVPTKFGMMVGLPDLKDADLIVVCINRGYGYEPKTMLLPHQLYLDTVQKLVENNPGTREIAVFPISSDSKLSVWGKL